MWYRGFVFSRNCWVTFVTDVFTRIIKPWIISSLRWCICKVYNANANNVTTCEMLGGWWSNISAIKAAVLLNLGVPWCWNNFACVHLMNGFSWNDQFFIFSIRLKKIKLDNNYLLFILVAFQLDSYLFSCFIYHSQIENKFVNLNKDNKQNQLFAVNGILAGDVFRTITSLFPYVSENASKSLKISDKNVLQQWQTRLKQVSIPLNVAIRMISLVGIDRQFNWFKDNIFFVRSFFVGI